MEPVNHFRQIKGTEMGKTDKCPIDRRKKRQIHIQIKQDMVLTKETCEQENLACQRRKVCKTKHHGQPKKSKKNLKFRTKCLQMLRKLNKNGQHKIIEHHHEETKKFIECSGIMSLLYEHFYTNFPRSQLVMVITFDNEICEEGHYIRLGNTREIATNEDPPRERRNPRNQDHGETIDLSLHRLSSHDSLLSSLIDASSSLVVYEDDIGHGTSNRFSGAGNIFLQSASHDRNDVYRPTFSSGYASGQRSRVSSGSFSFSLMMQVDRSQIEDQNSSHAGSNFHETDQHHFIENQEVQSFSQDNPNVENTQAGAQEDIGCLPILPLETTSDFIRIPRDDAELQASAGADKRKPVSLREKDESDNTTSKMVRSKLNNLCSKSELDQMRSLSGAECPAQTSENLLEGSQIDETFHEGLGAHGTDPNGALKKLLVPTSTNDDLLPEKPTCKEDNSGQQRKDSDKTERRIHSSCRVNDFNHRNSTHFGSFDRLEHHGCHPDRTPNEENGWLTDDNQTPVLDSSPCTIETVTHVREQITSRRQQNTQRRASMTTIDLITNLREHLTTEEQSEEGGLHLPEDTLFGNGEPNIPNLSLLVDDEDFDTDPCNSEGRQED